jgi:predicted dehydrogenase
MKTMVEEIEQAGVHAQLGYMYNYSPVVAKVQEILASRVLGHLTLARFHAGAPVGGAAEIWQSLPEDMGGVLYTDGCHMLAIIVRLLGQPHTVTGRILKITNGVEVTADVYKQDTLADLVLKLTSDSVRSCTRMQARLSWNMRICWPRLT